MTSTKVVLLNPLINLRGRHPTRMRRLKLKMISDEEWVSWSLHLLDASDTEKLLCQRDPKEQLQVETSSNFHAWKLERVGEDLRAYLPDDRFGHGQRLDARRHLRKHVRLQQQISWCLASSVDTGLACPAKESNSHSWGITYRITCSKGLDGFCKFGQMIYFFNHIKSLVNMIKSYWNISHQFGWIISPFWVGLSWPLIPSQEDRSMVFPGTCIKCWNMLKYVC